MEHIELRKELVGALIGLAKTCNNNPKTEDTDRIVIEGLVAAKTESFGETMLKKKLEMVRREKHTIAPNCSTCASPCGNTSDYNLDLLNEDEEQCRALKEQMLQGIQELALALFRAMMQGMDVSAHTEILYAVLEVVSYRMDVAMLEETAAELSAERQQINDWKK